MRDGIIQSLAVVLLCIFAAMGYGIVHDLITANICVEYFTIGHPPVFYTDSPVELALGWGVVATWWVGLILGVVLAVAARGGYLPPVAVGRLVKPVLWLLAVTGAVSIVAGVVGFVLARNGVVFLIAEMAERVPRGKHVAFLTDLWMHLASYLAAFVGGVVLAVRTYLGRRRAYEVRREMAWEGRR